MQFYDRTVNLDMASLYSPFLELVRDGGHILDAGCGSGRDSLAFKNLGYRVTAMDASEEMVRLSSALIGQPVLKLRFQGIQFTDTFDGIWACASLPHVPRREMDDVLDRLSKALKQGGVLYASFKYGQQEIIRGERYFNCYDEESFLSLLAGHPEFVLRRLWKSEDIREDRKGQSWLNALLQKQH